MSFYYDIDTFHEVESVVEYSVMNKNTKYINTIIGFILLFIGTIIIISIFESHLPHELYIITILLLSIIVIFLFGVLRLISSRNTIST